MNILSYDHSDLPRDARVAIYGSGVRGQRAARDILEHRKDVSLSCFLDSFEEGTVLGIPKRIFTPEALNNVDLVLVASTHMIDIINSIIKRCGQPEKVSIYAIGPDFFPRQAIISHRRKFIFIPLAKVAHTSFRNAFAPYSEHGLQNLDFTAPEFDSYFKFSFVRSPISRFASMFNEKITKEHFHTFFMQTTNGNPTFSNILKTIVERKQGASDPHWLPQSFTLWTPDKGLVADRVYKLEELDASLRDLQERLGIELTMPHRNKSKKKVTPFDLAEEDEALIRSYYAQDFELLEYD